MSIAFAAGDRGRSQTTVAIAGAIVVGALYPLTASVVGPFAVPIVLIGVVLLVVAASRPGVGVAVAFILTSLTPGLVGPKAWVPAVVWTSLLFALVLLRPSASASVRSARLAPLVPAALLYAATVLAAFALSPAPDVGLPIMRSTITGVALFVVAASTLRTWSDITMALRGTSGAALLVGGFACLQKVVGASTGIGFLTSTGELVPRVTAGFGHPNLLGGFLVLLVPLAGVAAAVDTRWRLLHVASLVLALGGIYASFSRGALLAVLLIPFLLLRGRWLLVLVPVGVLALAVGAPSVMTERFALAGQEGGELAGRRDIWATAAAIWVREPWVGVGLGGFPGTYATVRVAGKQFLPDTRFKPPPHAHNLELQLLAEQGLLGLTSFAALAGSGAWRAMRLRRSAHKEHAVVAAGLLASLAALLVHNLFDVTLLENAGVQFWGVLGILSVLVVLDRQKDRPDDL